MKFTDEKQKLFALIGLGVVVCLVAGVLIWKGNSAFNDPSPQTRVSEIMKNGVDTSHSLFTPDETKSLLDKVNSREEKFLNGADSTAQNLMDMARGVRDLRDFDKALALFNVVDQMQPADLFYKIDVGNIYIERQQWEEARQVFEPMRTTFPVHETYLGLVKAYQHIDGTPDYVIDEIYKEGIWRTSKFELYDDYVKWLESKGREKETLPYYEAMEQLAPQPLLEQRIKELKAKYAK